jgi:hypothetical protein
VEISISGRGIHIWFTYSGVMPPHGSRAAGIGEFYHRDRYICIGAPYEAPGFTQGSLMTDHTASLPGIISTFFPPDVSAGVAQEWSTEGEVEFPDTDDELIALAMRSKSKNSAFAGRASFADLWLADEAKLAVSYPDANGRPYDASLADSALAQHLAFWTANNCERIRTIMQRSALVRDKYDREDYLPRTILRAVGRQSDVYEGKRTLKVTAALTVPSGTPDELNPEDFYAHLPSHSYINRRTREFFSVEAINGSLKRFTDGHCQSMKPALWLDHFRAVQQMSWYPGQPEVIEGMISDKGYLRPDPKGRIYNLYRTSDAESSDEDASPWVNHVKMLFGADAEHIIKWFAFRLQYPGEKINHALVIGGIQGIGKDLMLQPIRYGVGRSNAAEINPADMFKDFTGWVESTLVVINEARDLGDDGHSNKYKFYESSKRFIAAPPDTLPCNRKYLASYDVPNVMGIVITSNNKLSGLYLEGDDRRHFVAWSALLEKPSKAYFRPFVNWLENGGIQAVVGYLKRLNLEGWDCKSEPPKTEAWHQIVAANANPDENELGDALEGIQIATVKEIIAAAMFKGQLDLVQMLQDRKNARKIPHILERIGLEALPNPNSKVDGRWRLGDGRRETIYVDRRLSYAERIQLANKKTNLS